MRSGEPGTDDAPSSITHTANDPRLRWYPPSWRARYGDELVALLDEEYGGTVPVKVRLSLVTGGLRQRARQSGLVGDTAPATDGVRAGALVVLAAWAAFVIAGASFAKFSEHFDEALPHRSGAHRVPDLAFTLLQTVAGVASLLVVAGAFLALPAFVRFLRAGGWASVRRHFMRALVCTALVGVVTLPLLLWAHHLTPHQRNGGLHWYGALFLLWAALIVVTLALWTAGRHRDGQASGVLASRPHRGGGPGRCHRRGDGAHGRRHGGLVGGDGEGRTRFLERQPRRRPWLTVGSLVRRHGWPDVRGAGRGRLRRGPRTARLDDDAFRLNDSVLRR